jgi:murein tripeptide amidase MpaA
LKADFLEIASMKVLILQIMAYIDEVVTTHANIASVIEIGRSYEGRPIRVVKLSNGPGKSAIFFDSVLHAREWIGPPTLLFAINELTENLAYNQALLDANDWYFLLVANPDGFIFSWTDDRLWRKSRSPNANTVCFGTDLNRNFDQHWAGL